MSSASRQSTRKLITVPEAGRATPTDASRTICSLAWSTGEPEATLRMTMAPPGGKMAR
jgi:hypothetical protein